MRQLKVFISVVLDDPRKKLFIFLTLQVFRVSSQQELSKVNIHVCMYVSKYILLLLDHNEFDFERTTWPQHLCSLNVPAIEFQPKYTWLGSVSRLPLFTFLYTVFRGSSKTTETNLYIHHAA
jgi:hypothetical protein